MILYNVTIKIDRDAEEEWLEWMKSKHIPDILATRQFISSHICKLLDQPPDDDSTYVIQYRCKNREQYDTYMEKFAAAFRKEYDARYRDKYVAFRTLMEEI